MSIFKKKDKASVNVESPAEEIKQDLKRLKREKIVSSIIFILLGLVLLIWPGTSLGVVARVIGAVLTCGGIVAILMFLFNKEKGFASSAVLTVGVIVAVIGAWIFINPSFLVELIPTIIGLIVIISGILNLSECLTIHKLGKQGGIASLILAVVTIALGALVLVHPGVIADFIARIMGVVLAYNGVSDLYIISRVTGKVKEVAQAVSAVETTAQEITGSASGTSWQNEADADMDADSATTGHATGSKGASTQQHHAGIFGTVETTHFGDEPEEPAGPTLQFGDEQM